MSLLPGLTYEENRLVAEEHTAASWDGEKFPHVLSTPHLIGWVETCAHDAISTTLDEDQGSVGTVINIRHLAATPVGMKVRIRVELIEVERSRLEFKVEAWDEIDKILEGEHERFVINLNRFQANLDKKKASWKSSGNP